ncbi:transposase [Streptomyces sp. NPDC048484]|uniref:transposase n=1 Tax=Streptomyces sp. NPDC048484 TaxID=3155146 RepID=UPI0034346F93
MQCRDSRPPTAPRSAPALPHAIGVDHFHVVQLAIKVLSVVRRRTTAEIRGRRGHATDPERKPRRRLPRNREDVTADQFAGGSRALRAVGPGAESSREPTLSCRAS